MHHKSFLFASNEQLLAAYCKALGHPARCRIIHLLCEKPVIHFGEIADQIPLSIPTVQSHIRKLISLDIIHVTKDSSGSSIGYQLRGPVREEIATVLQGLGEVLMGDR